MEVQLLHQRNVRTQEPKLCNLLYGRRSNKEKGDSLSTIALKMAALKDCTTSALDPTPVPSPGSRYSMSSLVNASSGSTKYSISRSSSNSSGVGGGGGGGSSAGIRTCR